MPGLWARLLDTTPFSASRAGFTELVVRAVGPAEPVLAEPDLRSSPMGAVEVVALANEFALGELTDAEFETKARWDVWVYDPGPGRCRLQPAPLTILCRGEAYDDGVFRERGHFEIDAGFEHLFTGHANLLGRGAGEAMGAGERPVEAEFLARMADPELRRDYQTRTRENIHKLFDWMRRIEEALAVERYVLWSEGEENFEARVDEILALR